MSDPIGPPPTGGSTVPPGPTYAGPSPRTSTHPLDPGAGNGSGRTGQPDWTDQVTDLIVDSVDKVRDRTTGPILEGAKGAVYAVVAMIVLVPVVILVLAGMVRLLNYLLPGDVWVAYAAMSVVFVLVGVVLWRRRGAPAT
jgi:hypothetical protein